MFSCYYLGHGKNNLGNKKELGRAAALQQCAIEQTMNLEMMIEDADRETQCCLVLFHTTTVTLTKEAGH